MLRRETREHGEPLQMVSDSTSKRAVTEPSAGGGGEIKIRYLKSRSSWCAARLPAGTTSFRGTAGCFG
jgi:hypothetical protein